MRHPLLVPLMLMAPAIVAPAQVNIGINLPGLSIGINQPVYPDLVPVPDSPVYYAPGAVMNYFFYDGLYWVYQGDAWYSSVWFNGPWGAVGAYDVPYFLLRVPVGYYRQPPPYFYGWDRQAPPRWGEHWGPSWQQRRDGWDHWDHHAVPVRAPLPAYQRTYSGDRYPQADQQVALHSQNYRYQPKETVVRERYQQEIARSAAQPGAHGRPGEPPQQGFRPAAVPQPPPQAPGPRPGSPAPPSAQQPHGAPLQPPPLAPGPRPGSPAPPSAQQPHGAPPQPPKHDNPPGASAHGEKPQPGPAPQPHSGDAPRPGNSGPPAAQHPQGEPAQQQGHQSQGHQPEPAQHGQGGPPQQQGHQGQQGQGKESPGRGGSSESKHGQGSD